MTMTIGQRIRGARNSKLPVWSREDLSERANVSVKTIEGIETGRTRKPALADVAALCAALGIDLGELAAECL